MVTVRIFLQFGQVVKCRCPDFLRPFPYRCDADTFAALQSSYNASASRRTTRSSTWRIFKIRSFLHRLMNTGQLSAGMWFSLSRYRLHISASTGVCTLPNELFPKPTALQMA